MSDARRRTGTVVSVSRLGIELLLVGGKLDDFSPDVVVPWWLDPGNEVVRLDWRGEVIG